MIVPNKFFHTKSAKNLREFISGKKFLNKVVDFGFKQVFHGAINYSCIIFGNKEINQFLIYSEVKEHFTEYNFIKLESEKLTSEPWYFESPEMEELLSKFKLAKNTVCSR